MEKRKPTEEEKEKIAFVVNDFLAEVYKLPEEPTEYDVLIRKKVDEFKESLFEEDEPYQVEALVELSNSYIDTNGGGLDKLVWTAMFDMWVNKSPVWPVPPNPEWKEWEKLKEIKATKV